jgi:hypothetical protein
VGEPFGFAAALKELNVKAGAAGAIFLAAGAAGAIFLAAGRAGDGSLLRLVKVAAGDASDLARG